ncbi:MAG TPA: hypothetical protein VM580_15165, partial [Labilithrix sp.]|nr:hypothetical protein [Labilithrix sp.]
MTHPVKSENLEICIEPETHFICVTLLGRIQKADALMLMQTITAHVSNFQEKPDPYYILVDIRRANSLTADARKAFADSANTSPKTRSLQNARRIAVFGGSFAFRTLTQLILKALSVAHLAAGSRNADEPAGGRWTIEADEAAA